MSSDGLHGDNARIRYVKVVIELPREDDDWPPVGSECLWAEKVSHRDDVVRLDNIPFYARGFSSGDLVAVEENEHGELIVKSVETPSGISTFQIIVHDVSDVGRVRSELRDMGYPSELADIPTLIAVEIPAELSIEPFLDYILENAERERLGYQEAALRHSLPDYASDTEKP